jgi:hypothetical protein
MLENQKLKIKSMKDIINMYYHYFQTEEFDGDENIDDRVITKDTDKLDTSKSYTDKSSTHKSNMNRSNTDKLDTKKLNIVNLDKNKSNGTEVLKEASKLNKNTAGKSELIEINTKPSVVSNKPLNSSTKSAEVNINPTTNPNPNQVKTTSTETKESSKLVKVMPMKTYISPLIVSDIPTHRLLPPETQVFILIL